MKSRRIPTIGDISSQFFFWGGLFTAFNYFRPTIEPILGLKDHWHNYWLIIGLSAAVSILGAIVTIFFGKVKLSFLMDDNGYFILRKEWREMSVKEKSITIFTGVLIPLVMFGVVFSILSLANE